MRKVFGFTFFQFNTKNSAIVRLYRFRKSLSIWYIFIYFFALFQTQYGNITLSHPGSAIILEFPVISSFTACGVQSPFLSRPFLDGLEVPS